MISLLCCPPTAIVRLGRAGVNGDLAGLTGLAALSSCLGQRPMAAGADGQHLALPGEAESVGPHPRIVRARWAAALGTTVAGG